MIRMSRLADYGSLLMTYMARQPFQAVHTAADLAAATHLPVPTVSKILKLLSKAHIVASHRGAKGGYSLAREAQAISLVSIIVALEGGPFALTECSTVTDHQCELETECLVRHQWQTINQAVYQALGNITLHEMAYPRRRFDAVETTSALNEAVAGGRIR
ncbi:MAG: SUF system Fe-S cluster assembly regulator [Candidatus Sericytochromatia bacterium]|nr:SUF system Fe-S cluster assembly regulator [Candidatus Sericytochromatia bacterium]